MNLSRLKSDHTDYCVLWRLYPPLLSAAAVFVRLKVIPAIFHGCEPPYPHTEVDRAVKAANSATGYRLPVKHGLLVRLNSC